MKNGGRLRGGGKVVLLGGDQGCGMQTMQDGQTAGTVPCLNGQPRMRRGTSEAQ